MEDKSFTPCPSCGGSGAVIIGQHYFTRDMATDAGEPGMEGMFHSYEFGPCEDCDGSGTVESVATVSMERRR